MDLRREIIAEQLKHFDCPWENILILESTGSTNKEAYELAKIGADTGTVVMAEYQTAGRGRMTRIWNAKKGSSLLFSLILRNCNTNSPGVLMLTAAAAVRDAIAKITKRDDVLIKWPNDIFIDGKKCCGILAEAGKNNQGEHFFVLGVGLNVNNKAEEFNDLPNAASLFTATDKEYDRNEAASSVLGQLHSCFAEKVENILAKCRKFSYTIGKEVCVNQQNKEIRGKAIDIDNDGFLILCDSQGKEHKIICGDVV